MKFLYTKKKDKNFYEKVKNYIYNRGTQRQDIELKEKYYEFFSGNIEPFIDELNKLCNDPLTVDEAENLMLSYNKIFNKYMVLEGELMRRGLPFKIQLINDRAIKEKDEEFREKIKASVQRDLELIIEKSKEQLQQMSPEQVKEYLESIRGELTPAALDKSTYLSEYEIYKNKMLKYITSTQDFMSKRKKTFRDVFIFGEFYLKNEWKDGKPYIKVLNPLNISYYMDDDYFDISKADWVRYTETYTVGEFLDEYINVLSDNKIEEILGNILSSAEHLDKRHIEDFVFDRKWSDFMKSNNRGWLTAYPNYDNRDMYSGILEQRLIKDHIEFKAYDQVAIVTYTDEYNDQITEVIDDFSFIPDNASKIKYRNEWFAEDYYYTWEQDGITYKAEIIYIPQRYEMTIINGSFIIEKRKCPMQPVFTDNPFENFTLSYKGGSINNIGSKTFSLMDNAIPLQLQYLAVKAIFDRELSKYKGLRIARDLAQLPDELANSPEGEGESGDVITTAEIIASKTGNEYFDSENTNFGAVPSTRSQPIIPLNLGNSSELIQLQQLLQMIDYEIGLACLVPPSREGQIIERSNVTDNERAVFQTTLATESIYFMHDYLWVNCIQETLYQWDLYFKKYFELNPDTNSTFIQFMGYDRIQEIVNITPEFLKPQDAGVIVANSFNDAQYVQFILQKIQQNTNGISMSEYSEVIKSITSGISVEEIHKKINELEEELAKKEQQRQEAEVKLQQQLIEKQKELIAFQTSQEIQKERLIEEERRKTKILEAEIDVNKYRYAADVDENRVSDKVEAERIRQEHEDKRNKEKIELEKLKLKTQKEIAEKTRNNNKSKQ